MSSALPIERDTRIRDYAAAVGQTVFSFDAPLIDAADLAVFTRDAEGVLWIPRLTGFAVVPLPDFTGATVTFSTPPRPDLASPPVFVRLKGARVHERLTDVVRGGAIRGAALEGELDRLTIVAQELRRDVDADHADETAIGEAVAVAQAAAATATGAAGEIGESVAETLAARDVAVAAATTASDIATAFGGIDHLDAVAAGVADARAAAEAARDDTMRFAGVFATTDDALSKGVVATASLVGGSGGTTGIYDLVITGPGRGARGKFRIDGGAVAEVWITDRGVGYTTATAAFTTAAGLTGASVTLITDFLVGLDRFFAVPHAAAIDVYDLYRVTTVGSTATWVNTFRSAADGVPPAVADWIGEIDTLTGLRDQRGPYGWWVGSALGETALGVERATGRTVARELLLSGDERRLSGVDDIFPIRTEDGRLLAAWRVDGHLRLHGLDFDGRDPRETGDGALWSARFRSMLDGTETTVLELRPDGIDLVPSARLVDRLTGQTSGDPRVFGVQARPGGGAIGWAEEDGIDAVTPVIRGAASTAWLPRTDDPLDVMLWGGQSLAYHGGNTGVAYSAALYPISCVTTSPTSSAITDEAIGDEDVTGFAVASDLGYGGQRPQTLTAFAIEALLRRADASGHGPGTVSFAACWGGQPLSSFIRDTNPWLNLMRGARRIAEIAADQHRDVACAAYFFLQGENGPNTQSVYEAELTAYVADVLPALRDEMGLSTAPVMIVEQPSIWLSSGATGVERAILDVSLARPDVVLAGPVYAFPIGDVIHPSPIGKMSQAEMLALAWLAVKAGADFQPLRPISITRAGPVIDITFRLPEGLPLAWGDDVVPAPTGATNPKGFTVSVGGTPVAISSVTITGDDTVRIVCAVDPGACDVSIALVPDAAPAAGWVNARALLYSPSASASVFAALGFAVPSPIRHWCVRGQWSVA